MRAFNRFYTGIIGLLDRHILHSRYSLPEVRILFEVYYHEQFTAKDLQEIIRIDKGYLSRILSLFEEKKLITRKRSKKDGRARYLVLTKKGKSEFEILNRASHEQIREILLPLRKEESKRLIRHMKEIQKILAVHSFTK